tara:strand:+ start:1204 stop:1500 length:297 start_codon:yes stop_codon:yes gene_type:complete
VFLKAYNKIFIVLLNSLRRFSIILFLLLLNPLYSQESYKLNDIEINNSTKSGPENNLDIPSNPFQLVEMIRRANSMNDATNPSDAIDEALKSFDMINN